jgi:homoserine kinase
MRTSSVLIRVPATVGNFAGAKDAAALALDSPLNVKVTPRLDGHVNIRYFGENGNRVPRDRSNLVARAMESALHLKELEFTGADFEIYSSVPVAVGLGSSTAAVVAGLAAADRLYELALDEKTLFELAAIYESRGDNLRAAWFGGFVAAVDDGEPGGSGYRRSMVPENFVLSVVAPDAPLGPTGRARGNRAAQSDAAVNRRRAASLAEFFARPENASAENLDAALPPTCVKNLPGLEEALKVRTASTVSVFVCGSGPAVGILAQGAADEAVRAVSDCFARAGVASTWGEFRPSNAGARDWNAVSPEIILPPARALSAAEKSVLLPV